MKGQGIRSTLSQDVQSQILSSKIDQAATANSAQANYFYKAYETFIMLKGSSQVDDQSDMKNSEILRVQGFSQNLIYKILQFN